MKKLFLLLLTVVCGLAKAADDVTLTVNSDRSAVMSNGLLTVTFNKSGNISSITTADDTQVMTTSEVGYFSFDYRTSTSGSTTYAEQAASEVETVTATSDMAEIRYTSSATVLGWTIGYIMRRGVSGIYAYATVSGSDSYNELHEARFVYRMNPDIFNYSWTSDSKQGTIPSPVYMRGWVTELQDATWELLDGSIYTKYDWANYVKDDQLHGLMGDAYGAWLISPSAEWVNGGVAKQELTTHATDSSPVVLQMLHSQHFGAAVSNYGSEDQKLFGPCLFYVNSGSSHAEMIADAKSRSETELAAWPYKWFNNDLYPKAAGRGTVTGNILVTGAHTTTKLQVVLGKKAVKPQLQNGGYQYWTETDDKGNFTITDVRPGNYVVYAYALDGDLAGMFSSDEVTVKAGDNALGVFTWALDTYGETLWQIGESDHTTAGFSGSGQQRQYGLWKSAPANPTFVIGESDPATDWYYTQSLSGTWTIKFQSETTYTDPLRLTIATAGACGGVKLEVKVNANDVLQTIAYNNDAAVYRSGILSGRDSLVCIDIPAQQIVKGNNFIYLKLTNVPSGGQCGIMYDMIKLETGNQTTAISAISPTIADRNGEYGHTAPSYDLNGRRLEGNLPRKGIYIRNGNKYFSKQ